MSEFKKGLLILCLTGVIAYGLMLYTRFLVDSI